jgi:S1-C subfamily serine protease
MRPAPPLAFAIAISAWLAGAAFSVDASDGAAVPGRPAFELAPAAPPRLGTITAPVAEAGPVKLPISAQSGTGFVIHADGIVLTNAHVVVGCDAAEAGGMMAARIVRDEQNDLALLFLEDRPSLEPLGFSQEPLALGASAIALGFPLPSLLAPSLNVTEGVISAMAGVGGDSRYVQFSAPVQIGNSGGPLVDGAGSVVGMVTEKLDALAIANITGAIPEGISFALRREVILAFLSANGVEPTMARSLRRQLDLPTIVNRIEDSVLPVSCAEGD